MTKNEQRNAQRQLNYDIMIKNGFSSKEARQSRDWSTKRTLNYVGQKAPEKVEAVKTRIETTRIPKPRGIQYKPLSQSPKEYLSNYTYIISYDVKKFGGKERQFVTITSPVKLTKKEVLQDFWDNIQDEEGDKYNTETIIKGSITIDAAYER